MSRPCAPHVSLCERTGEGTKASRKPVLPGVRICVLDFPLCSCQWLGRMSRGAGRQPSPRVASLPTGPYLPESRPTSTRFLDKPCPLAGGFLFLTSASISQKADSLADGLPRSFGNPILRILDRWPSSLSLNTSANAEHTASPDSHSHFGQLEFLVSFSFILRKKKSNSL